MATLALANHMPTSSAQTPSQDLFLGLGYVSLAVIKHHVPKQLEEERLYLTYRLQSVIGGS